jgi:hypothetical protein
MFQNAGFSEEPHHKGDEPKQHVYAPRARSDSPILRRMFEQKIGHHRNVGYRERVRRCTGPVLYTCVCGCVPLSLLCCVLQVDVFEPEQVFCELTTRPKFSQASHWPLPTPAFFKSAGCASGARETHPDRTPVLTSAVNSPLWHGSNAIPWLRHHVFLFLVWILAHSGIPKLGRNAHAFRWFSIHWPRSHFWLC